MINDDLKIPPSSSEIADLIIEELSLRGEIKGSALGIAIRRRFPHINFRQEIGKLSTFIENNCAGKVRHVGKHQVGSTTGDDIYALVKIAYRPDGDTHNSVIPYSAWQVFIHPSGVYQIGVQPLTGDVSVLQSNASLPVSYVRVKNVSQEEHREILESFVDSLEDQRSEQLIALMKEDRYWSKVMSLLNIPENRGLRKQWNLWRTTHLQDLLRSRLEKLISSPEATGNAMQAIIQIKEKANSVGVGSNEHVSTEVQMPASVSRSERTDLRQIVHDAVDDLSYDDLRRIWLPLGAVIELINARAK